MLNDKEQVTSEDRIVGYMNKDGKDASGSVIYGGDNQTGGGDAEFDETMNIKLNQVPDDVQKIAFVATIYEAQKRKQKFGMVTNSIITGINASTNQPIFNFDLGEDFSNETAIIAAEVYKYNGEWKFNPLASGYDGGLVAICKRYGIDAEGGN
jgi:tellurium resistance protein TerD